MTPAEWLAKKYIPSGIGAYNRITDSIDCLEGYEGSVLHELIHAALGHDNPTFFTPLLEGLTEAITQVLAKGLNVYKHPTYRDRVFFITRIMLPSVNLSLQHFARTYASKRNKKGYFANIMQQGYYNAGGNKMDVNLRVLWQFFYKDLAK